MTPFIGGLHRLAVWIEVKQMTRPMLRTLLAAFVLVSFMNIPALSQTPARATVLAQANRVVIDFEDALIPQDATEALLVSDKYKDLGVIFNSPVVVNFRDWDGTPGFAASGKQAIHQCESSEQWCDEPLVMTFTEAQSHVGVVIGFSESLAEDHDVTMTAFDAVTGGNQVDEAVLTLFATDDAFIPAQSLEVSTDNPGIRRVEVGFPPQTYRAADLIFDDVMFSPEPPRTIVDPGSEDCLPDTAVPALSFNQPKSDLVVHENRFTLQGKVTTTQDLLEATLTRDNGGRTRTQSLIPDLMTEQGGAIGRNVIENFLAPGENMLTLRARNCAGTATIQSRVDYQPTEEGTHFALEALEVTQTIQDPANSVRLVAGKRTFVRVFLATAGGTDTLANVTAALRACRVASADSAACPEGAIEYGPLQPRGPITVDSRSGSDNLVAKRGKMKSGLLFELPPEWTVEGFLRFRVDSSSLSPQLWCDGCDNASANAVRFEDGPSLTVDLVDVRYTVGGVAYTPSETDHGHLLSWLKRAYPTNDLREVTDIHLLTFVDKPTCYLVAQGMFAEWVYMTYGDNSLADAPYDMTPTRHYGLVAAMGIDDRDPIRGCALIGTTKDEDQRLDNEYFASGPAGSGMGWRWDLDDSYADWYGGHEIAHTFERKHIAHCLQSKDEEGDNYPGYEGLIDATIDGQRIDYIGFDAGDGAYGIPPSVRRADKWHDVMTYCPYVWMSAFTYDALWQQMAADEAITSTGEPGEAPAVEFVDDVDGDSGDDVGASPTPDLSQPVLMVLGSINMDTNKVDFRPFAVLPDGAITQRDALGEYRIVLRDGNFALLAGYRFDPQPYSDIPVGAHEIAQLSEIVPWVEGTRFIDIERGNPGTRIARQRVSDHAPTVLLTGPTGGGPIQGTMVPVTWDGRDQDGDNLIYSLHYSVDAGATWQSLVSGLREDHFDVDLSRLPGSNQALFRVIATDGVLTAEDQSGVHFIVSSHAPEVSIISPEDRSRFGTSHTIVLVGEASDIESGKLPDNALTWTTGDPGSSDSILGHGRSIAVSKLAPGRHIITLTATDADGLTAATSITVRIEEDNPPEWDWTDPNLGTTSETLGTDGLFLYDNIQEAGAFFAGDGEGHLQPQRTFDVLLNGWSSVTPGNFGGDSSTDLLFYASELGVGEFYASDGAGGLSLLSGNEGFTRGWDLIVPVELRAADAWTSLLFYDREEGVGKLYTTDGTGRIQLVGDPVSIGHTWTSIVAGQFGDDDRASLLLYDKWSGQGQRLAIDEQGAIDLPGEPFTWGAGWDTIVPGQFGGASGRTDLLVYDADTGNATVMQADDKGTLSMPGIQQSFPGQWDSVVGGRFGANSTRTALFFYDAEGGVGSFYVMNDQGEFEELGSPGDLAPGWDQIVPGYFGYP